MKYQYFTLIWYLFLTNDQKQKYKRDLGRSDALSDSLSREFLSTNFTNEEVIKEFLFMTSVTSISNISHRRKNFFSFNPMCKDDFIYLTYIENFRDLGTITFLQRIFLSRLVFKLKNKTVTFKDIELDKIKDPIIIEVNNV